MQSKDELENWYAVEDPWDYEMHPDDQLRKQLILESIQPCNRVLDIGAGEGWITKDIPAKEIHAIEISDKAAERFPENVKRVFKPEGEYDLVITTGTLYKQYDYKQILAWITEAKPKKVIIAGIEDWLPELPDPTEEHAFQYREYTQVIKIYETPPQYWGN